MKRRGNGEGSIYRRKDGRWCGSLVIGYDANGKRRRRIVYGRSRAEVKDKFAALQSSLLQGTLVSTDRTTVAEFLEQWVENSAQQRIRPATCRLYRGIIRNHINPVLGGVQLNMLTPAQVQALYGTMARAGKSPRLRQLAHAVLHRALTMALRWNLVVRNAAAAVEVPRAPRKEMKVLGVKEVARFLGAAREDRLYALYVLAIATGLRQGELLGLQWADVALAEGYLFVRRQLTEDAGVLSFAEPKTAAGRRRVDLPAFAVEALRQHRKALLQEGHPGPLVFCDSEGNPVRKSNLIRRSFAKILVRAGVPRIRFHDLRHTAATLLLAEGVHPKIVQERLGHAQISLTLDTYSHVLPSMQRDAARRLDAVFATAGSQEDASLPVGAVPGDS